MIHKFHSEDLPDLLLLRKAIEQKVSTAFFNWPEDVFIQELQSSQVWLSKNSVSGFIEAFLFFREEWDRLEIMVLGTSPFSQKKGLMTEILQQLQGFAARQGKAIGLEVHEKNEAARRLYLKQGFKFLHCRKNYYKDGGGAELYLWKSQT